MRTTRFDTALGINILNLFFFAGFPFIFTAALTFLFATLVHLLAAATAAKAASFKS